MSKNLHPNRSSDWSDVCRTNAWEKASWIQCALQWISVIKKNHTLQLKDFDVKKSFWGKEPVWLPPQPQYQHWALWLPLPLPLPCSKPHPCPDGGSHDIGKKILIPVSLPIWCEIPVEPVHCCWRKTRADMAVEVKGQQSSTEPMRCGILRPAERKDVTNLSICFQSKVKDLL